MAATTTLSTSSLIDLITPELPDITFHCGELCKWHADSRSITYTPDASVGDILHEIGHALLDHQSYDRDVTLLEMERDAWRQARVFGRHHGLTIDEDIIQSHLDTYRDWLHARSTCPECTSTGIQTHNDRYRCYECSTTWRVNEARQCSLRRYTQKSS